MNYPDILTSLSGKKINSRFLWENFRRGEIAGLFGDYVYGKCPAGKPDGISFKVTKVIGGFHGHKITYNEITAGFSDYSFKIMGFVPEKKHKVPAFVYLMIEAQEKRSDLLEEPQSDFLPVLDIAERGYAVFVLPSSGIYPDWENKADYRKGVFGVLSPDREKRRSNDWAAISAWAWGMSRVIDCLETRDDIDSGNIAVAGHSRGGKTALWCAANDSRASFAVSNASGCMGAAVLRGKTGEHIKDINITDWFCENFKKFNDNEEMLPVDQHMLLSLIAPRLLYVESCSEDDWADPLNERLACRLASQVYSEIYGLKGAVLPDEPVEADKAYHEGSVGYHMKSGKHSITSEDWNYYMDFWDKKRNGGKKGE